ncbi:FtsX-like permease family protein [Streptomyces sp. NRRL S-350]|uniref:FtsX-like permease family protein n=1 Tax=Streptomyces sp. NRRL S-350 TaxID=1463902 RepID=UPI0004BFA9EA|nr:FtsX-like permease family protein [Streptomyces sp. NRRL S-350]
MTTKGRTALPDSRTDSRTGPRTDHRPAPWVRTRLRASPLAAVLMAALAFVTVFLAASFPRFADRGADAALRDFVSQRGLVATSMQTSSRTRDGDTAADLDTVQRKLVESIGRKLPLTGAGQAHGARTTGFGRMLNEGYARLSETAAPGLALTYLAGLADHVTLVEGTWPGPATRGAPLPVVVSRQAAGTIGIKLGDVVDNGTDGTGRPLSSVVTGFYRVNDPLDPFWGDLGCPARACLDMGIRGDSFWKTTGFIDGGSLSTLAGWGWSVENFWRLPVDTSTLRADQLDRTRGTLNSFVTGPDSAALATATRADLHTSSLLTDLLTRADARYRAAVPLSVIGPAGVAGVATVVLCLAAALNTDRRTAEIRLLQARGGSRGGVLRRLLGEGLVTVLPGAVLGTLLALVLLPTPRWGAAVAAGLAAALLALLAFPARAALLWSRRPTAGGRRRLVGELAVLVVTVAAVAEVRRRGVGHGSGVDPLLVAAPLLLAVAGGLLLARIEPLLVGRLASLAGRGRGLIGFLGLARAARDSSGRRRPSALPLLALLIAVTTTGFGATVLDAVDHSRSRAGRITTGGDVSVVVPEYGTLPEAFTKAAGGLPGVRAATKAWVEPKAMFIGGDQDYTKAVLVVVEPTAYAEIARTLGVGEFDPAKLANAPGGADTPVPALFSRDLAKRLSTGAPKVRTPNGNELRTTVAGIVGATPALPDPGLPFVVMAAAPAAERLPEPVRVNSWFAVGDVDPGQVRTVLREQGLTQPTGIAKLISEEAAAAGRTTYGLPPGYTVHSSRETIAALAADPLQHASGRLFWYAAAGGAGFALLAVLLTLFRAAPERTAVLARLRTMSLRPRQGLALIIAEAVPQTLAAAVGGALAATAAVALLGSAFDISTLVGARVGDVLAPALMPVLLPTAGLALLVGLAVVLETLIAGRRQIATELRAGERP